MTTTKERISTFRDKSWSFDFFNLWSLYFLNGSFDFLLLWLGFLILLLFEFLEFLLISFPLQSGNQTS